MIIGLDISTSVTGVTILSESGEVIVNEAIVLKKKKNFFDKVEEVKKHLLKYELDGMKPKKVFIETPLMSFKAGASSASVISLLLRFNGVVSYVIYDMWGIEPEYIPASSARKEAGLKVKRGTPAKEQVLEHVIDTETGFVVEHTRYGNVRAEVYDRADSLIIARAGYSRCMKEKNLPSSEGP